MPTYAFEARRPTGDLITGSEEAPDKLSLKAQLARRGLLLVKSQPVRRGGPVFQRAPRVKPQALLAFVREFRHMIAAGLPVAEALSILGERRDDAVLAAAISGLRDGIEKGQSLDEAAAAHSGVFDRVFQATVRAGVVSSQLPLVLSRLERLLCMRDEIRRKVRSALAYPTFLAGLLAVVLAILFLFVLPRFAALYSEFGADLPTATQILMTGVETAPLWIPGAVVAAVIAAVLWRQAMARAGPRAAADRILLRLPVIGRIARDIQLVQVSYILSMLLRAGMPLKEALEFVGDNASNAVIRAAALRVADGINEGRSLSDGIAATGLYPATSEGMIRAGERSGALADLLDAVASMHEQAADDRLRRLLTLLEPAMMLLVGIVLGAIIIVVYLPVFGIAGVVQ